MRLGEECGQGMDGGFHIQGFWHWVSPLCTNIEFLLRLTLSLGPVTSNPTQAAWPQTWGTPIACNSGLQDQDYGAGAEVQGSSLALPLTHRGARATFLWAKIRKGPGCPVIPAGLTHMAWPPIPLGVSNHPSACLLGGKTFPLKETRTPGNKMAEARSGQEMYKRNVEYVESKGTIKRLLVFDITYKHGCKHIHTYFFICVCVCICVYIYIYT